MTKRVILAVVCCVLFSSVTAEARELENGKVNPTQGERVPGVLVIQLADGFMPFGTKAQHNGLTTGIIALDELGMKHGMSDYYPLFPSGSSSTKSVPLGDSPMDRWHLLAFDESVDLDKLAAEYAALPEVEKVEFDHYAYIMRTPNDAQYSSMYQLNQANDRDMDAPEAWEATVGSPDVVLADTDTGVLWWHEDLINNVWVNPGEDLDSDRVVMDPTDMNGIDDDGNGYIDDLIGWDFVSNGSAVWPGEDGGTQDNDPKDFNGHGTHTSGTIAAQTNNTVGVSGVAGGFGAVEPGCKIMCLRMGWSYNDGGIENGYTQMTYVASAFTYAYRNGAVAINYSFGSSGNTFIEQATDSAVGRELVICASAGNDGNSSFGYLQSRDDVLCVASTTNFDIKSGFSNYGDMVDVSAPGSSIRSTVSNHYTAAYATYSGTSMAAPQVVGQVGLIRSLNPLLTRQEVFDIIMSTADNIDGLNPSYAGALGTGRINLNTSVQNLASTNFAADPLIGQAPLDVQFYDSSQTTPTAWLWSFGDGDSSTAQNPAHTYAPGLYNVTLRTETAIGNGLKTKVGYVTALAETLLTANEVAGAGSAVAIEIWGTNNQPISEAIVPLLATNIPLSGTLDSVVTSGCRTEYFEDHGLVYDNRANGKICLRLRPDDNADGSPEPLEPGSGPLARVWFTMNGSASPANAIVIDTATLGVSQFKLSFKSPVTTYVPHFEPGTITVPLLPGDMDFSGAHDVIDVVSIVDVVFRAGTPPNPPDVTDANCDSEYTILDVVRVVEIAFRNVAPSYCP